MSLLTYIAGGLGIVLVLGTGVEEYRINSFRAELATEKTATAQAVAEADHINTIFAQNDAKNERARADNEAKMRAEADALRAKADALEAMRAADKKDFDAKSSELRKIIANAKASDKSPLGRAVIAYFNGLRSQQQANGPSDPVTR